MSSPPTAATRTPIRPAAEQTPETAYLTRLIARGDRDAFAVFYEAWVDRALALARAISRRDESFCLDVVHDAMLRVVRSIKGLNDERAVESWMARTITTTTIDRFRSERRRTRREHEVARLRVIGDEPGDDHDAERLDWLRRQIAELPENERRLILERFGGDQTLEAVGASLGITGHAAHGRIRRILARLRHAAGEWLR